jgi:RNA-directed DNA polymerase
MFFYARETMPTRQKINFKTVLVATMAKTPSKKNKAIMKRIGNLYDKIISIENLKLADERARKGKRNSYGVRLHDRKREENIYQLHELLKSRSFTTSEYHVFKINEPKEREIYRLPYYPDRIVHHAIMNILEPIWVSIFTADTYSCIKGRGINGAMNKVKNVIKEDPDNTRYCLKIDVRKYYPSIDHKILQDIVARKIKCKDTLGIISSIIVSAEGVPIGNYLSQYFANLYLAYLDHYVKEVMCVRYYYRYADDMIFFGATKKELHQVLADVRKYLHEELKLLIKSNYQIFPISDHHRAKNGRGLDFVGFVFYRRETRIRKSIKMNFVRKAAKVNRKSISTKDYTMRLAPWIGWAKYSNSKKLIYKIIKKEHYESVLSRIAS